MIKFLLALVLVPTLCSNGQAGEISFVLKTYKAENLAFIEVIDERAEEVLSVVRIKLDKIEPTYELREGGKPFEKSDISRFSKGQLEKIEWPAFLIYFDQHHVVEEVTAEDGTVIGWKMCVHSHNLLFRTDGSVQTSSKKEWTYIESTEKEDAPADPPRPPDKKGDNQEEPPAEAPPHGPEPLPDLKAKPDGKPAREPKPLLLPRTWTT